MRLLPVFAILSSLPLVGSPCGPRRGRKRRRRGWGRSKGRLRVSGGQRRDSRSGVGFDGVWWLVSSRLGPLSYPQLPAWLPSLSAQTCNACHGAIHDQWAASGHSRAASNPVYRAAVSALDSPDLVKSATSPFSRSERCFEWGLGQVVRRKWSTHAGSRSSPGRG